MTWILSECFTSPSPFAEAVETGTLTKTDGVTKLTVTMAFRDMAGRDHMPKHDGQESSTSWRVA